ncbi:glycosyltransferase family 2 protein [Leuconostoc gelidum subsp. gasicomitatum]|uniref:glycosyltransferase family 2 protein n=1 Tax=Leuconostoc gasicomitatum TaxID=115778 RepID=UPI001CC3537E|nr:glycosyltransferase family 2 protein [Leuconostoc gasicomitatum]MBZ5961159.1 glycosyltransferase family 2 protein [Leuconostoc gasicomitatum]MBZ5993590.1 glycosyltransferase family 2 protein [Leuconostoc gasicomitatum]
MMQIKVSIIVPVYNVINYLQQSVNSILNQTYNNLQIILVDDGSTDGSSQLVDFIKQQDDRVEVIHKKNEGLSEARNIGFTFATGEYVYFFDSDDLVKNDLIEDAVEFLEDNMADFVTFTHDFFDENSQYYQGQVNNSEYKVSHLVPNEVLVSKLLVGKIRVSAWSYIFRRQIYTDAGIVFQKGKKYEDNDTTPLLILSSKRSGILQSKMTPYYHYRRRANSITSNFTKSNYYDLISITNSVAQIIKKNTSIAYELDIYCLNQYLSAFRILKIVHGEREEFLKINKLIRQYLSIKLAMNSKKTLIKFFYWRFWSFNIYSK